MKRTALVPVLLVSAMLFGSLSSPEAGELPPSGSLPLSAILRAVEERALGAIAEVEFDDGYWEVKVCDGGSCQKLYLAPSSGDEWRRRSSDPAEVPPASALRLSALVQALETRETGVITEIEFDDGFWDVELRREGQRVKLSLDPLTGAPRR
jgi:hypothetical protein